MTHGDDTLLIFTHNLYLKVSLLFVLCMMCGALLLEKINYEHTSSCFEFYVWFLCLMANIFYDIICLVRLFRLLRVLTV